MGGRSIWRAAPDEMRFGLRIRAGRDGCGRAASAIESLRGRASERGLAMDARVADLEKGEYRIEPAAWDFIAMCYYLQRDLFEAAKQGVVPGGVVLAIVHAARARRVRPNIV